MRETSTRRRGVRAATAVALWALLVPRLGAGESALDGVALFSQARFDEAESAFRADVDDSGATAVQIATAHLYIAALRLIAGDEHVAARHVLAAVALDPTASAPDGAPLRLEEMLREAATRAPEGGMSVAVEVPSCPAAGGPVQARAVVTGAPPGLVSSFVLRCSSGEASQEAEVTDASTVSLVLETTGARPGSDLSCEASARSGSGAVLRSRRVRVTLCRPSAEASSPEASAATGEGVGAGTNERDRRRPRLGLWIGVGVGATVAAAVAVALGVVLGTRPDTASIGEVGVGGP